MLDTLQLQTVYTESFSRQINTNTVKTRAFGAVTAYYSKHLSFIELELELEESTDLKVLIPANTYTHNICELQRAAIEQFDKLSLLTSTITKIAATSTSDEFYSSWANICIRWERINTNDIDNLQYALEGEIRTPLDLPESQG